MGKAGRSQAIDRNEKRVPPSVRPAGVKTPLTPVPNDNSKIIRRSCRMVKRTSRLARENLNP
jgi:hypothetical protein